MASNLEHIISIEKVPSRREFEGVGVYLCIHIYIYIYIYIDI